MEENPRKPRRFQFSLRTIFVVTTVAAVLLAVSAPLVKDAVIRWREREMSNQIDLFVMQAIAQQSQQIKRKPRDPFFYNLYESPTAPAVQPSDSWAP